MTSLDNNHDNGDNLLKIDWLDTEKLTFRPRWG